MTATKGNITAKFVHIWPSSFKEDDTYDKEHKEMTEVHLWNS